MNARMQTIQTAYESNSFLQVEQTLVFPWPTQTPLVGGINLKTFKHIFHQPGSNCFFHNALVFEKKWYENTTKSPSTLQQQFTLKKVSKKLGVQIICIISCCEEVQLYLKIQQHPSKHLLRRCLDPQNCTGHSKHPRTKKIWFPN